MLELFRRAWYHVFHLHKRRLRARRAAEEVVLEVIRHSFTNEIIDTRFSPVSPSPSKVDSDSRVACPQ